MKPKFRDFSLVDAIADTASLIAGCGYTHLIEPLAFGVTAVTEFYSKTGEKASKILYSCFDANDALRSYVSFARAFIMRRLGVNEKLIDRACNSFLKAFEEIHADNVWQALESNDRDPEFYFLSPRLAAACHYLDTKGVFSEDRLTMHVAKYNFMQIDSIDPLYLVAKRRPCYKDAQQIKGGSAKPIGDYKYNAILIVEPELTDCYVTRNTTRAPIVGEPTPYLIEEWHELIKYCSHCTAGAFILTPSGSKVDEHLGESFVSIPIGQQMLLYLKSRDYVKQFQANAPS